MITRDRSSRVHQPYSGATNSDARNSQSPSVEDAIVTPDRQLTGEAMDGVWSANLAVTTCQQARPTHPLAIGPT